MQSISAAELKAVPDQSDPAFKDEQFGHVQLSQLRRTDALFMDQPIWPTSRGKW